MAVCLRSKGQASVKKGQRGWVPKWSRGPPTPSHPQMKEDHEKVFFGVRADSRIFDQYRTLLMEPQGPAIRVQPARPTPIPATTR